jgi:adenosine deaminase
MPGSSLPHTLANWVDPPAFGLRWRFSARRASHGIRAVEDAELLALLVNQDVSLDVCLTSNHLLGIVPSLAEHPLPRLLAAGVRCSLGTDDPLMFSVGLFDEYEIARTELGLTDLRLADLARTSIETSDAPMSLIEAAAAGIDDWLAVVAVD